MQDNHSLLAQTGTLCGQLFQTPSLGQNKLAPIGFAHRFITLVPDMKVIYKVTNYYAPAHDKGILWSDPALGIDWPLPAGGAVLSDKDTKQPLLADIPAPF